MKAKEFITSKTGRTDNDEYIFENWDDLANWLEEYILFYNKNPWKSLADQYREIGEDGGN